MLHIFVNVSLMSNGKRASFNDLLYILRIFILNCISILVFESLTKIIKVLKLVAKAHVALDNALCDGNDTNG